ncbi:MAG: carbohydrate kinase [Spirochaetaceae bacterium]|jgi:sugar (pentulose or hexulose) kinase|nr:carbohydrate kinase [Spirochaetaceae bacterium]
MEYAIAVIDIGMTNKKVAVYDDALKQADARYRMFPPKLVDGLETHDLDALETWFIEELADLRKTYPIKAIAVTTHGAAFVCVGKDGHPVLPCVYYTHEPGDDFHNRFYARFGPPETLQAKTGTPYLKALINPAKGIFFVQERYPDLFRQTHRLLQYPQYWGFRFTGKTGAEGTYMGCHGYLWDHAENRLSSVAEDLGAAPLMPKTLNRSWDILGTISPEFARKTGLSPEVIVTMGIHDSNSSLLPHFAKKGETGFVLNSTGTWCVSMNPVKKYGFAPEELGKVVFFNISAFGTPVKTAIFLGGQEFEIWSKLLMDINRRGDIPSYNDDRYRSILRNRNIFLLPELTPGSGQFPQSRARVVEDSRDYPFEEIRSGASVPPCFRDYETGFAVLRLSLVMQSITSFERIGIAQGAEIFSEGGFRKDTAYNGLLSSALPENRVFLTDIAEATALGAAMTAKMALAGKGLADLSKDFEITYQEVAKTAIPELAPYRKAWLELANTAFPSP